MTGRIVILGGGTGGTLSANRLRRTLGDDVEITVVDQDDRHVYQPGLLFAPFGLSPLDSLVRPRRRQLRPGIGYRRGVVQRVDLDHDRVHLADGAVLPYDLLVIATGARLLPEETEGLATPLRPAQVHTFYDYEGAQALARALAAFDGGRLVVDVVDMPIKCPVAPLEFCFLADWYFRRRGIRDAVSLTYVTPLDAAFTKPVAAAALAGLLARKDIDLVTEFTTGSVEDADGAGGRLVSFDEREVPFDLAVMVPLHGGAAYVEASDGLGDELGFVPVGPRSVRSTARPDVFVLGDAAAVPTSKAGSGTHVEGEILTRTVARFLAAERAANPADQRAGHRAGPGPATAVDDLAASVVGAAGPQDRGSGTTATGHAA
ncbi:FAD/NAD(P)-binding oxidoreductase [Promicromonospora sp. NPDC052451]|uniref:FAD/NAD(P)-binding oxidoreductase n=1 Tax=Promicromonospora sp. NPDC052451 TaxID=3364407 RepID=UPI0037C9BFC2